jgi:hypothetical protein
MAYIGKQPLVGNFTLLDSITATTTDTYALTKDSVAVFPQTPANCIVSLNGVIQAPTDSYTISGSDIVFASALTGSDSIDFITVLGDVLNIGTPSDNTVSLAKLTATGTKDATTFLRGDNTFASAGGANTPAFKALMNANQSASDNTFTKINFDTESYDTDSCYDSTTNYRFTPTTSGKYFITSSLSLTSNQTGSIIPAIYFNGSEVARGNSYLGNSTARGIVATTLTFNGSSDYVEIYVYQSTGGTRDINKDYATFEAFKLIGV